MDLTVPLALLLLVIGVISVRNGRTSIIGALAWMTLGATGLGIVQMVTDTVTAVVQMGLQVGGSLVGVG